MRVRGRALGVVGADSVAENARASLVVPTHVPECVVSSVTVHCHAATAAPTREYQSDHRRLRLTSATPGARPRTHVHLRFTPLDNPFHIREERPKDLQVFGRRVFDPSQAQDDMRLVKPVYRFWTQHQCEAGAFSDA